MHKKRILIIYSLLLISWLIIYIIINNIFTKAEEPNLDKYNKLMIVAHPDDEMLWGGANLIKDNYFVVCVTCGENMRRFHEFKQVMEKTNDKYIALNFPNKIGRKRRSKWLNEEKEIIEVLKGIIDSKDWEKIVTHNPKGEYGHIHHKKVSRYVTNLVKDKDKLYYFENYCRKGQVNKERVKLSPELVLKKQEILAIYKSQRFIKNYFYHMLKYEELIKYEEWYERYG